MNPGSPTELPISGLTASQAADLIRQHGPNRLQTDKKTNPALQLLRHFLDPISVILLAAAAGAGVFGEIRDALVIACMVLLSVVLDFVQEYRSSRTAQKLAGKLSRKASAIRDGRLIELSVEEVVPGDVLYLSAGDIVCADGKLLSGDCLSLNEAALTGESLPVEKQPGNPVLAGTAVVSGFGYMQVEITGYKTKIGQIATNLESARELNSFEKGAAEFSSLIFKTALLIILAVLAINLGKAGLSGQFTRENILQTVLFAITVAVGLTPELLPVITSVNKARGSLLMSREGVLVKRLDAIPVLGSVDILCSDKTGTLTQDKISLVKYLDILGRDSQAVLEMGFLNSHFQSGYKNTLDRAVLEFRLLSPAGYTKLEEIPYDFERRRLSVAVRDAGGQDWLITKGQPEKILEICTRAMEGERELALDAELRSQVQAQFEHLSEEGYRVLGICRKELQPGEKAESADTEQAMALVGWLAFLDPPKPEAGPALERLHQRGMHIKIITGDNQFITQKVCSELGFQIKGILTGDQADQLQDAELAQAAEQNNIFARFTPEQKKRLIRLLRSNGHVVGYLGDGINDAPSLQAADVGISVDNAVDVAREAADIILLNKNLDSLLNGVEEGRKTFGNTLKYMRMALSSNFGNMLSVVAASLYLPFLPMLPVQVLLNNSLYDISQLAIPTDRVDPDYLSRPRSWDIREIRRFMLVFGPLSSAFDILTFWLLYGVWGIGGSVFQTTWFVLSLSEQILVIFVIRTRRIPFLQSSPSLPLLINTLVLIALGAYLPYSAVAADFGLVPLEPRILWAAPVLALAYLLSVQALKVWFFRKFSDVR